MGEARYERLGAATGLVAVALFAVGFLITPRAPGIPEWSGGTNSRLVLFITPRRTAARGP